MIVVTGYADLQGAIAALRQGATDYILKPLNPDLLRTSLRRIAERRQLALAKERSEAAFRHLVEAAECMIVILRPDHTDHLLQPVRRGAHRLLRRRGPRSGLPRACSCPRPTGTAVAEEFVRVIAGQPDPRASRTRSSAATARAAGWSGTHATCADYEDGPAILKVGQDITFLKQAQERALQAERLAAIGQMVTGLAHESRNALQRSQACLEMLALASATGPRRST